MTRDEILDRYRRLRAVSAQLQEPILKFVSGGTVLEHARRLGLVEGRRLTAENEAEMMLAFDLALYTAKEGRSTAIDRYARAASLPPGSDEARLIEAMRHARFSIWRVERRHETAGVIVRDVLRGTEEWLVDEAVEASAPEGAAFTGRLCEPEEFAMACGLVLPVSREIIEDVTHDSLAWRRGDPAQVAQDPRFALAVYRAVLGSGIMSQLAAAPERAAPDSMEGGLAG